MDYSTPGFPVHHQFLELAQTHVCWVGDAIQPSHPLSPTSPAFNLSQHQGLFQWVNSSYQVAKVSSFSFSISLSNEYPGLIFFKMDWFYLLAVLGTLKNLLHHHSLKASILQCSALFMVQLSHPYITTGKTIALIRWTFVFMANPKRMASEHWVHSVWPLLSKWLHTHGLGHDTILFIKYHQGVSPFEHISEPLDYGKKSSTGLTPWNFWKTRAMCLSSFQKSTSEEPFNEFPRENLKES